MRKRTSSVKQINCDAIDVFLDKIRSIRNVIRYSADSPEHGPVIALVEVAETLGHRVARLARADAYFVDAYGRPAIEVGRLRDLLERLKQQRKSR
jgi:hypothetical protein